jgi:hypothetical protein
MKVAGVRVACPAKFFDCAMQQLCAENRIDHKNEYRFAGFCLAVLSLFCYV